MQNGCILDICELRACPEILKNVKGQATCYQYVCFCQGAVRAQTGHPAWGSYSNDLLSWGLSRPREGARCLMFFFALQESANSQSHFYVLNSIR